MASLGIGTIILASGAFLIGLVVGGMAVKATKAAKESADGITNQEIRLAVGVLIGIVWGASVLLEQYTGASADPLLWIVMGAVVGYLFKEGEGGFLSTIGGGRTK